MRHKIFFYRQLFLIEPRLIYQGIQSMLMHRTLIARKIAINQSYPTGITGNYPTKQAFVKGKPS